LDADRPWAAASEVALEHRDAAESDPAAAFRVAEYELAETVRAVDRLVALTDEFPVRDKTTAEAADSKAVEWSAGRTVARLPESGSWPTGASLAGPAAQFSEPAAGRLAAVCCWEVARSESSAAVLRSAAAALAERRDLA
jgi:hypothetical protein